MAPGIGIQGALESLLMDAVVGSQAALGACVDAFRACVAAPALNIAKDAGSASNAAIAAWCVDDPSSSVSYVWKRPSNPIPIASPVFDPLATFLRDVSVA